MRFRRIFVLLLAAAAAASAEDWKALLADADPARQLRAAEELARNGAADAVPELAECLIDAQPKLRAAAARALGSAGAPGRAALPELRHLFRDPDRTVRIEALSAVARLGDVGAVVEAVRRDKAVLSLFGAEQMDVLAMLLGSESWHVRLWVLQRTEVCRHAPGDWTARFDNLAANDPAQIVRLWAVGALAENRRPEAAPALARRLADADPRLRAAALVGLALARPPDEQVVPAIERCLSDDVPQIRAWACFALRGREASAAGIAPLLEAEEPELRVVAAAALGASGVWPERNADELIAAAIDHGDVAPPFPVEYDYGPRRNLAVRVGPWLGAERRYPAVGTLAREVVVAAGGKAVPPLVRAMTDEATDGRRVTLVHLLGTLRASASLEPVLHDPSPEVRRHAAATRAWLGEQDAETIDVLVGCLGDPEESRETVDWAATAGKLLEGIGDAVLPALEARLAVVSKVTWRELGNGGRVSTRSMATEREEQRIRELIARIRGE